MSSPRAWPCSSSRSAWGVRSASRIQRTGKLVRVGTFGSPGSEKLELVIRVKAGDETRDVTVRMPISALNQATLTLDLHHGGTFIKVHL